MHQVVIIWQSGEREGLKRERGMGTRQRPPFQFVAGDMFFPKDALGASERTLYAAAFHVIASASGTAKGRVDLVLE
jgi:hypothetical protein